MKPEIESTLDQLVKMALDLAVLCALLVPALAWIHPTGQIDCNHNCLDLHDIGYSYNFEWPLAVAITLGIRAIYAFRISSSAALLLPIVVHIPFAMMAVYIWPYLIAFTIDAFKLLSVFFAPVFFLGLFYAFDRTLARFDGKSINLPKHRWQRVPLYLSLLVPMIMIVVLFLSRPHLYWHM